MSRAFLSPSTTSTQNLEFCTLEKEGHLLVVTINRPKSLNALHAAAHIEFNDVFDDFERDPDLWVAIVTGEGRAFSAGNDLVATAKGTKAPRGAKPPAGGFCLLALMTVDSPSTRFISTQMNGHLRLFRCAFLPLSERGWAKART